MLLQAQVFLQIAEREQRVVPIEDDDSLQLLCKMFLRISSGSPQLPTELAAWAAPVGRMTRPICG